MPANWPGVSLRHELCEKDVEMKRLSIKLDEGQVSYLTDGQGPPLLLLHSLGVSSESWSRVIESLAQSWSVYALDMMGHGDSDKPPRNYLIEDYAQNVIDFADRLSLGQIVLCGNSVGALTVLEVSVAYPERVKALVLVGCPGWDAWGRIERLMLSALSYDVEGNPLPATKEQLAMSYTQATSELIEWVNQQRAKAGLWMKKTMIAIGLYDVIPKLPLVRCPTLVVFGSKDLLREREKVLLEGISEAKHAVVPNAGHLPQMDNPHGFLQEVKQFLSAIGS
jgi:pimeloyl-ACP methyl ester carboxylesterase